MSGPRLVAETTALNPHMHDLELDESGQPVWLTDDVTEPREYARTVAQRLKCRWLLFRGEWYLDQRLGTPWEQRLFRKGATENTVRAVFHEVAISTPGVRSVVSVTVVIDKVIREATIAYSLQMESNLVVTSDQLASPFVVDIPGTP